MTTRSTTLGRTLVATLVAATIAGCGPKTGTTPVKMDIPGRWRSSPKYMNQIKPNLETLARWWTVFGDPTLEELEERALSNNLDLKVALERIREARAMLGAERARLLPTLSAGASIQDVRKSPHANKLGFGGENKLYRVGFDSSWELEYSGE